MRSFIFLSLFFFNSAWAGEVCLTHGQCHDLYSEKKPVCFKVITGMDHQQKPTCQIICSELTVSGFCEKLPKKAYGVCRKEVLPVYKNPIDTCEDAIPSEIF